VCTLQRCQTTRFPTTRSITTLVNTETTEEVNNDGEPFAVKTVNLRRIRPKRKRQWGIQRMLKPRRCLSCQQYDWTICNRERDNEQSKHLELLDRVIRNNRVRGNKFQGQEYLSQRGVFVSLIVLYCELRNDLQTELKWISGKI
jgi:hypothetical protein